MDTAAEIKQALIKALGITPNLAITATVVSIENDTCTVKLLSELVLSDVRLKATISDGEDRFLIVPKINSEVILMSQTGTLSSLMLIKVDAVESIRYKKGDFEFAVDGTSGKVTLKNSSNNFGALVTQFITEIKTMIILTPTGPGKVAPSSITKFEALDAKFKTLLNSD
ncbi:hypothetical protein [Flavobacterium degerlachei]|jgi:hypothetical protein|uniref:Uncharacterized protein n=1 Tax=Flavobacterium degerlachei TaxID=229203 RepID=A0A1H2Z3S5_9FLAO|nr:hypothetical protein [Flavobacterium degerlachei]SDX12082.1 hypothetical protein SAMN05444338_10775 [Flavobacterium degerlachei]